MDKIIIHGGRPLQGKIRLRGAKNAALPLMAASILAETPCIIHNIPCLHDVFSMEKLLNYMGAETEFTGRYMTLNTTPISQPYAPYDLVRKMRASFFVLGPLVARFGYAKVSLPGGCTIGTRPVDIHLKGLEAFGCHIGLDGGYVVVEGWPRGGCFTLDFPSVGATETLMMAACKAKGTTRLTNVAREPEIEDLARFLNAMGACIMGAGTDTIIIEGGELLSGVEHEVIPDRIEGGTFLLAGVATGGDVTVLDARPEHLTSFLEKLQAIGARVETTATSIRVVATEKLHALDIVTQPYPGYPTDLQAQMMAVLCCANGTSRIRETVFENRFMQAAELSRMGADIELSGNTAIIRGVPSLKGAPVMASDLRASAALVIAGLMASQGETEVQRVYHIDRGYERLEERLAALGADIRRVRA